VHHKAAYEAGVTEFAAFVLGWLEGAFDSMDAIQRYINELAASAAKF
jgi:hypothetical protein